MVEIALKLVGALLGLDKHKAELGAVRRGDQVQQVVALVVVLHPNNLLSDVLRRGADAAHGQEHVVVQEVARQHLDLARKRGREHERDALARRWHGVLLHDAADLRLEAHVEHAVSLVEHQVLDKVEANAAAFHQVHQAARRSHHELAAALNVAQLVDNVRAAVRDARAHLGAVRKLRNT